MVSTEGGRIDSNIGASNRYKIQWPVWYGRYHVFNNVLVADDCSTHFLILTKIYCLYFIKIANKKLWTRDIFNNVQKLACVHNVQFNIIIYYYFFWLLSLILGVSKLYLIIMDYFIEETSTIDNADDILISKSISWYCYHSWCIVFLFT